MADQKLSSIAATPGLKVPLADAVAFYVANGTTGGWTKWADINAAISPLVQNVRTLVAGAPYAGTHITNLKQYLNHLWSSATVDGFALSEPGGGLVDIGTGQAMLRASNSKDSDLESFTINAVAGIDLPNEEQSFIYVDYNAGTPIITHTTDPTTIDGRTKVPIWLVTRINTTDIHIIDLREYTSDFMYYQSRQQFYTEGFKHVPGGTAVSETGPGYRKIAVTAGSFYLLGKEQIHDALDTGFGGTFTTVYYNGSSWVRTAGQTVLSNTHRNDIASGLVALSNNKYGVHWLYVILNSPSEYLSLYGQEEYATLADAQAASVPAMLPPEVQHYSTGQLIAKVIVQEGEVQIVEIQSPFQQSISASSPVTHNNLAGLQGGSETERYHITSAEWARLVGTAVNYSITQNSHGFVVGDVLYNDASIWTKAQANNVSTLGIGIVSVVVDTNNFKLTQLGIVTEPSHGFNPGSYLFLSELSAGALTIIEPSEMGYFSNPIAYVLDANNYMVLPWRPTAALPRYNDRRIIEVASHYDVTELDEAINVDASTGPVIITLLDPTPARDGFTCQIKKIDSTANTVTIKSNSGNIDSVIGTTGQIITGQNDVLEPSCDGTDYWLY